MMTLLHLALAASIALAGCSISIGDPDSKYEARDAQIFQYYNVILHPPNLVWDDAEQKLSGNITISVLPPAYPAIANPKFRVGEDLSIDIGFLSSDPPSSLENRFAHVDFSPRLITDALTLGVGETGVWNFSVWPKNPSSKPHVEGIQFDVSYRYDVYDQAKDNLRSILVLQNNPCLDVVAGGIQQFTDRDKCEPYEFRRTIDTAYYMSVQGTHARAIELWNTWDNIWTYLIPAKDYLNNFDYGSAKIKYFKGEVRCGSCHGEGYDYQRIV